jgi:hypothetical protein
MRLIRLLKETNMKPIIPFFGVNRRALLSTLVMLPALSAPFFSVSAPAQATASGGVLPSWNDGPAKQAIFDFVRAWGITDLVRKYGGSDR